MVNGMLWIVGIYGFCMVLVQGLYRLQRNLTLDDKQAANEKKNTIYVALITLNNQTQIEWYLRSFLWMSLLRGRSIYVTVFDAGSTDETVAIAAKLASTRDNITVETSAEGFPLFMSQRKDERVIVLQLMNRTAKDSWLIPYW
jgi:hypothetical protein